MFFKYSYLAAVALCVLYGVVAVRSDTITDVLLAENKCLRQYSSISTDVIAEIKKTNNVADYQKSYPDLNCFFRCVAAELNLIDTDGVLNAPALKKVTTEILQGDLTEEEIHAAVDKCTTESEHDDHCEKIGLYIICKIQSLRTIKYHEDFCPECS